MSEITTGGRPAAPKNEITAARIKEQRKRHRETQATVGAVIGYGKATVARYEKNLRGAGYESLVKLAEHWNIPVQYLTGETDMTDCAAYYLDVEASASEAYYTEEKARRIKLENFFSPCGLIYEYLDGAQYDFIGIGKSPVEDAELERAIHTNKRHRLTAQEVGISTFFNDDELQELFSKVCHVVHDAVVFECFCKKHKEAREHGND